MPGSTRPARARSGCRSAARRSACSACSACRSGAFRPHDLLFVYEEDGRLAGLVRVEREIGPRRVDDRRARRGSGSSDAGDIRFRLVQQLLREGAEARRGPASTSPAPTRTTTSSCSCRPASCATARRPSCTAPADRPLPEPWTDERAADCRIRPAVPLDARRARSGSTPTATPPPVQRLEALRLADWERQGANWRVPRSSLTPILRFADVEAFVQEAPGGGKDGTQLDAFVQIGVAKEDQPHYLKVIARPERRRRRPRRLRPRRDRGADRQRRRPSHRTRGSSRPVRTYESPIDRRLEEAGFDAIATVTLLMKETLVRVAEPALVPAGVR